MKNTLNILVPKLLIIDSRFISLNISSELINILIQILCTLVIHIITFINWISTTLIISISKYLLLLLIWYILLTLFLRTCNQSVRRVDYTSDSRFITFKYSISCSYWTHKIIDPIWLNNPRINIVLIPVLIKTL